MFHCNYNVNDLTISSQLYTELLQWWAEFRDELSAEKPWRNIIWNNEDIRIDNKPIFYKTFFESGITHITDLRFDLDITESYNIITKKTKKASILVWAGLRHAVPSHLISKSKTNNLTFLTMPPSLNIDNVFDILMKNVLFVSLNQKPSCTFFLTAYTQSFSGKILNFTFALYQKK